MFTQRENAIYLQWCYLLAMANVFFIVKKYVENAFFRDLEIQIYWLSKQNNKKLNLWEKTAVDKSAWIKACYVNFFYLLWSCHQKMSNKKHQM